MSLIKRTFCAILFLSCFASVHGQDGLLASNLGLSTDYSNCAAIFYKDKMLVDKYSPDGRCKLEAGITGKMTLAAVSLSEDSATPTKNLNFQVAIQHKETQTLWLFTKEPVQEVLLEDVLKACKSGDKIIFLTTDKKYNLPHNVIDVIWGC